MSATITSTLFHGFDWRVIRNDASRSSS